MRGNFYKALMPVLVFYASCGLESPIINAITRDSSTKVTSAADTVVFTSVEGVPEGATLSVTVYSGAGSRLEGIEPHCYMRGTNAEVVETAGTCADSSFILRFRGNTEFVGVRVVADWGSGEAWGIIPHVPKRSSVLDPEYLLNLSVDSPAFSPLSHRSTTIALIMIGTALSQGRTLQAFSPDTIKSTGEALSSLLEQRNEPVVAFHDLVGRLLETKVRINKTVFSQSLPMDAQIRDLVDADALAEVNETPEGFEQKLLAAAAEVKVAVCYSRTTIRVVFQVDLRGVMKDGNCKEIETFKWAKNLPGKKVFFTGGVHKDTPVCGSGLEKPYCITQEEIDAANAALGNWIPNQLEMSDDGTGGDSVKGDRIYTLVLDLPYIPIDDASPTHAGMRIGYKYTYGTPGQGWTDSEEWPGNQRLLELIDVNGDGLVVRRDIFGDETTNKDKANALSPANGGCGVNYWENEIKSKCGHDTRETLIDTDSDCKPDSWPSPGPVAPITEPCS